MRSVHLFRDSRTALRLPAIAVVAAATVLCVGALPASAAADTITSVQPGNGTYPNNGSATVTFTTVDSWVAPPTVTLTRVGAASDQLSGSSVSVNATNRNVVTATIDFTLANPGPYAVAISGTSVGPPPPATDSCASCVAVSDPNPLSVTSVTPTTIEPFGSANLVINGNGFAKGPYTQCTTSTCTGPSIQVLDGQGNVDTHATVTDSTPNATAPTQTKLTQKIAFDKDAVAGPRTIKVFNSDGSAATCTANPCMTVNPPMAVTSLAPPTLTHLDSGKTVIVNGANFPTDVTARFLRDGSTSPTSDVTIGQVTRNSATMLTLSNVSVSSSAPNGGQSLVLVSSSDHVGRTFKTALTIVDPPAPSGVSYPSNGSSGKTDYGQGAQNVVLDVSGTHFTPDNGSAAGARVSFSPADGITITGQTATTTDVMVTLSIDPNATPGDRSVTVTNPGTSPVTCDNSTQLAANSCVLTIGAGPRVDSVSPPSLAVNKNGTLTITGTGFDGSTDSSRLSITGATVNSVTAGNATSFTANVTAGPNSGPQDVTVTNPTDRGTTTCAKCWNIDAISVDSITPTGALNSASASVTVAGSNFNTDGTATLTLRLPATSSRPNVDIAGTIVGTPTATSMNATVPINGADPGQYQVIVTNPSGPNTGTGTCACTFAVVDHQASGPTITAVKPNALGAGATGQQVEIDGTDFYPHTGVSFSFPAVGGGGATVKSVTFVSATKLLAVVDVASGAMTSQNGNITVTNTDGKSASSGFTVNPAPTMSPVSPASRASSVASFTMTFGANNVVAGARVDFGVPGITAPSAVTIGNPDSSTPTGFTQKITVTVHINSADPSVVPGTKYDVRITNPDQGSATCAKCFTVNDSPSFASSNAISPTSGGIGTKPAVTLTGSGFESGATLTVTSGSSSIPATVDSVDSGTVNATFDLTASSVAANKAYDVKLTNPDGGSATLPAAFFVFDKPGAPTNVTAVASNQQATVSWTAPADNGGRIDHYTITTSPGGGTTTVSAPDNNSATPTSGTVTGLTNGTAYTFTVTAHNAAGDGPASGPSNSVTPVAKPTAPTGVTATAGDSKATVTWTAPTAPSGDSLKDFVVRTNPSGPTKTVSASTTTADMAPLTNGTAYTFTVTAEFTSGATADSAPSNSVTPFGKPLAPTGVTATSPGSGTVDVKWTAANANGAPVTSYTVTATPGGAQKVVSGSGSSAPATSATFTGLANGTSYTFTVTATNKAGTSAPSDPSNAVTPLWTTTVVVGGKQTISGGHSTSIGGFLRRSDGSGVANATITISQRTGASSAFNPVATVTTGSDGSWSLVVKPAMHSTYMASFAGDSGDVASSGQQVVLVTSVLGITSPRSGSTVKHGTIHFTAAVTDAVVGTRGSLQYRRSDGTWHTLATSTVTSSHKLLFSRTLGRGRLVLRAVVNKTAYNFSGVSRAISLRLT